VALHGKAQTDVANHNLGSMLECHRFLNALPIEPGAILGVEVAQEPVVVLMENLGMTPRHVIIRQNHVIFFSVSSQVNRLGRL
jgi:hypothetical protein